MRCGVRKCKNYKLRIINVPANQMLRNEKPQKVTMTFYSYHMFKLVFGF